MTIAQSVGRNGANRPDDVRAVQSLLNNWRVQERLPPIRVDGLVGSETIGAITEFQRKMSGIADGRVDPGGGSIRRLESLAAPLRPQLFLVEEYALRTYLGRLGKSDNMYTFNLLPGEKQDFSVISKRRDFSSTQMTSSVTESQDQTAIDNLNESVHSSDMRANSNDKYDYRLDASFQGDASWSPLSGSASADLDVRGGSNSVRDEFKKAVSSAVDTQVSKTDQYRRQRVDSRSSDSSTDSQSETKFVRSIENLDRENPVTFVFYQLSQEYVTLLSLVDVKISFRNGRSEDDMTVPLSGLDQLLERTITLQENRDRVKQLILGELRTVFDFKDNVRDLVKERALPGVNGAAGGMYYQIDPSLSSTYLLEDSAGQVQREIVAPGIIVRADRRVLPTNSWGLSVLHGQ